MVRYYLCSVDSATVLTKDRYSRPSKSVATSGVGQTSGLRATLDHFKHIGARHFARGEVSTPVHRAKEWALFIFSDAGFVDIRVEIVLGYMMSRYIVKLSTFLMETKLPTLSFLKIVPNLHIDCCAHSRKTVDHYPDKSSVS